MADPAPTFGPAVEKWCRRALVHGEGAMYGKPFRYRPDQRPIVWRWYEHDGDANWRHRRALIETPKGWGKTEVAAAFGHVEAFGPASPWQLARGPANVPIAAASLQQANELFGRARQMAGHDHARLGAFIEGGERGFAGYDLEMIASDNPSRMFRVAAESGTNDGGLPTLFIADEVHEWKMRKRRVHLVVGNSLTKRPNGRELNITTPGDDPDGLAYELHTYGEKVASGEIDDPSFLFVWITAPLDLDLTVDAERDRAIRLANPHASEQIVANLHRRFREIPEHEFRRYHLAQWVFAGGDRFLDPLRWDACHDPERRVDRGEPVVMFFDGSYRHDSTAIVAETLDGHFFVIGEWANPGDDDWTVPRDEVDAAVHKAFADYKVKLFGCDPPGWHEEIGRWAERYGDVVTEFPTHVRQRMASACGQFFAAVMAKEVTHDGDPRLRRHLSNAVWKETAEGAYITKDGPNSPRKIDLAVCAVGCHDLRTRALQKPDSQELFVMFT